MTNPFERPPKVDPFSPPVNDVALVNPATDGRGGMTVVVLDRVEPGVTPEYCVHGKVSCYGCDEWCWLGDETFKVVRSGEAAGLCMECATRMIPQASLKNPMPVRNLKDHRRKDGPH